MTKDPRFGDVAAHPAGPGPARALDLHGELAPVWANYPLGGVCRRNGDVDIAAWLRQLGLERYEQAFRDNDIVPAVLPEITDQDLQELGVSLGHRRLLLKAIRELGDDHADRRPAEVAPSPSAAPKTAPHLVPERRLLTVLFCDLVGSTELAARLDPEDLRNVMRAYHAACADVIGRSEGHVAKFLGDGVLAYFGWPKAHEDDAERAVRAGLALVQALAQLESHAGVRLQARVGIATGLAVVGDLIGEGAAREEAVVGDVPNLAARLQALAEPGTVVIAPGTRRLVGGLFELADLGTYQLKGFAEPVRAWRPVRESRARSRFEALRGGRLTPLVGRERELDLLAHALEQTAAGHGRIVAGVGDPGVGKSRLIDAFLRSDALQGWRVLSCGCRPQGIDTPWLPVVELIKGYFGIEDRDDQPQAVGKIVHGLAPFGEAMRPARVALLALLDLPVEDPEWQALNPPQRRRRILDAVKGLLQLDSDRAPLALVFEDLHWADSETVAVLDSLVDSLPAIRALLLLNYRPEFEHRWGGRSYYTQLRIDPLAADRAERLLEALLGDDPSLDPLQRTLIERTHGNPLFLEEAVRDLAETGTLAGEPGNYRLAGEHALTHEMAYGSLLRETRRTLHRRVGEAIEAIYPERLAELAEALTDHFERGEVWAHAARYALDAAEKAKSRYAYPVGMQFATGRAQLRPRMWDWGRSVFGRACCWVIWRAWSTTSISPMRATIRRWPGPRTPPSDGGSRTSATSCTTPSATARKSRTTSTGAATRQFSSRVRLAMAWLHGSRLSSACARNFASSPSIFVAPGARRPSSDRTPTAITLSTLPLSSGRSVIAPSLGSAYRQLPMRWFGLPWLIRGCSGSWSWWVVTLAPICFRVVRPFPKGRRSSRPLPREISSAQRVSSYHTSSPSRELRSSSSNGSKPTSTCLEKRS
jgi:class 3 adenylate cyclase